MMCRPLQGTEAAAVNAGFYDRVLPGQQDYWQLMAAPRFRVQTLVRLLAEQPPRSVVDLGCGGGELLAEVRARFPAALTAGVDLSQQQVEATRLSFPDGLWLVADLDRQVAFADDLLGRFDAVVAMEVIEHLDHPGVFLDNALRLAAPGRGRLLLSTQSGPVSASERQVGHRRHFSRSEISRLLVAAGWAPVRIWSAGFPFHDLSKAVANLRPTWSMKRFAERSYGPFERSVCLVLRFLFRFNSRRRGAQLFAIARHHRDGSDGRPPVSSPART